MVSYLRKNILYFTFTVSLVSMFLSLYFSEIAKFPPCVLCWYQRICMYPLAVILAVGILRKDKGVHLYVLPLSITGLVIASYHNFLYYKIIPEKIAPCVQGISCTTKFIEWFGFVTIPFLSFLGFVAITTCMIIYAKMYKNE